MTASQMSTLARGWLEYEELDYLLPDPHTHEDIKGLIATYYEGGCRTFARDMTSLAPAPAPVPVPTWFKPPAEPIEKTCEHCGAGFTTTMVFKRFCGEPCRKRAENQRRDERLREAVAA